MQGVSHVLLRGLSRAAIAATSFDVPSLLTILQQTGEGVGAALLPAFLGGSKASLRQLFRADGFFAYADDRQAQVGSVMDTLSVCTSLALLMSSCGAASADAIW
jgi:hypothetical protein